MDPSFALALLLALTAATAVAAEPTPTDPYVYLDASDAPASTPPDPGGGLYMRVPDQPPVNGRAQVWLALVLPAPVTGLAGDQRPAVGLLALREFDCSRRRSRTLSLAPFTLQGEVMAAGRPSPRWRSVASGSGSDVARIMACSNQPGLTARRRLEGLAGVAMDARNRRSR